MNNSLTESEPVEDTTAKDDGEIHSGVGVLDKTVKILDALESGPSTLGQLVAATGLARPTAHRLAIALERHRFVLRDQHGRFVLGSRFAELAAAAGEDRLLTAAGARMAQPGEFTIRAYLEGKLDLSQAEAVADIIASSSRASHALAANQMRGGYSAAFDTLREKLLHLASLLELELDFSEEEVEFADRTQLRDTMRQIKERIDALRSSFSLGNAIKEGVAVAIVGAPNVGKSTLLNRLLNEERAMVSDIAGTTRDVIEERANIDGIVFRFLDTAGIRSTNDTLEQMGIARTMSSIERAQIIIRLIDASQPAVSVSGGNLSSGQTGRKSAPAVPSADSAADTQSPDFPLRPDQTLLTVYNKIDKTPGLALPEGAVGISARNGDGIDDLRRILRDAVDTEALYHGGTVISNSRHYEALTSASEALSAALDGLRDNLPTDLLSEEIRQVIRHLSGVTGQDIVPEEVLKTIFSKFCIGK